MKRTLPLIALLFAFAISAQAQKINIDSIVKVVANRNPPAKSRFNFNKDTLFRRLALAKPGKERVSLICDQYYFQVFADVKQNIEAGRLLLAWTKAHHDLIAEAVIAAQLGEEMAQNGDKAAAVQLENEAMALAARSGDRQAMGVAWFNQNTNSRTDLTDQQSKVNLLKGIAFLRTVNDDVNLGLAYSLLSSHYVNEKKLDSVAYCNDKVLGHAIKANNVPTICNAILRMGYAASDNRQKLIFFKAAYRLSILTNNEFAISNTAISMADHYDRNNGNLDSGLAYAYKAYDVNKRATPGEQLFNIQVISNIYIKKRNIDSAIKYITLGYELNQQVENNASVLRAQAISFADKQKLQQAEGERAKQKNAQQRYILCIVISFLFAVAIIFWRNSRKRRKANILLTRQKQQTEQALADLKAAQTQLIQSEKMASLGELTAGIAHEIQNPLNFVNNFSEVSVELLQELKEEAEAGHTEDVIAIAQDLTQNLQKINQHGKRADGIVKGMLQHSRINTGEKQLTNINALADEFLKLSYHGLRAKDKSFNADIITRFDDTLPKANIVQQDIGRVLLNLFNNAFYAVNEKAKTAGPGYKPTVTVATFTPDSGGWGVTVQDNGNGIPDAIKDKIMQPFFTTKPTGQGTGLGLSLSYDIVVKGHGGKIDMRSDEGKGSEFTVTLPLAN